jgi:hypothetical protein
MPCHIFASVPGIVFHPERSGKEANDVRIDVFHGTFLTIFGLASELDGIVEILSRGYEKSRKFALILQRMICSSLFKVDVEVARLMSLLQIADPTRAAPGWHRQCFN